MGDNCYPFLLEMASTKDINVFLEHYPFIDSEYFLSGIISINGKVTTERYFDKMYSEWCKITSSMEM